MVLLHGCLLLKFQVGYLVVLLKKWMLPLTVLLTIDMRQLKKPGLVPVFVSGIFICLPIEGVPHEHYFYCH